VVALCDEDGENWTYYVDSADREIHLLYIKPIGTYNSGIIFNINVIFTGARSRERLSYTVTIIMTIIIVKRIHIRSI